MEVVAAQTKKNLYVLSHNDSWRTAKSSGCYVYSTPCQLSMRLPIHDQAAPEAEADAKAAPVNAAEAGAEAEASVKAEAEAEADAEAEAEAEAEAG